MASQASVLSGSCSIRHDQTRLSARLKRTLVLSLRPYVVVLLSWRWARLPQQGERPLTSVEVSLVSLPTPARQDESAKPVEPAKIQIRSRSLAPVCPRLHRRRRRRDSFRIFSFRPGCAEVWRFELQRSRGSSPEAGEGARYPRVRMWRKTRPRDSAAAYGKRKI